MQPTHRLARGAEHERRAGFVEAQQVDRGGGDLVRRDPHRAIGDVAVLLLAGVDGDPHGVALVALRERDDGLGQGGGEQQGAAPGRRGVEDFLELLAKAEVEHFVGLVEHDDAQGRGVELAALDMIAQASGGADDEMRAGLQQPRLAPRVHAADADDDAAARLGVEPFKLALNLEGQFARGRDDEAERRGGARQDVRLVHQVRRHRHAVGDGLARTRARRDEKVAARGLPGHRRLHRRQLGVAALGHGVGERRANTGSEHGRGLSYAPRRRWRRRGNRRT